jgi:hypothetical protein
MLGRQDGVAPAATVLALFIRPAGEVVAVAPQTGGWATVLLTELGGVEVQVHWSSMVAVVSTEQWGHLAHALPISGSLLNVFSSFRQPTSQSRRLMALSQCGQRMSKRQSGFVSDVLVIRPFSEAS